MGEFIGVKVALIVEDKVVAIQRDDKPDIPYAGLWDFGGGGSEGDESRIECGQREVKEELEIEFGPDDVVWQRDYESVLDPSKKACFMVVKLLRQDAERIVLREEGQRWALMPIEEFITTNNAVRPLQQRLQDYLDDSASSAA